MRSLVLWQWVVIGFVIALLIAGIGFFIAALSRSSVRRYLSSWRETRVYAGEPRRLDESPPFHVALPFVLAAWVLAAAAGLAWAPAVNLDDYSRLSIYPLKHSLVLNLSALWYASVPLFMLSTVLVHLRPNHSRQLKYSLAIGYIPTVDLFFVPTSLIDAVQRTAVMSAPEAFSTSVIWFWPTATTVLIGMFGGLWVRRRAFDGRTSPAAWEQRLFTIMRMRWSGPALIVLFVALTPVAVIFFVVRYLIIERFRQQPLVYLRSFHHDATDVFGHAIAPALARFGVIRGLMHGRQTASALFEKASFWQFGLMDTVPDESWQDWVGKVLRTARLVIVDCSKLTESVAWEVDQAMQQVGRRRVLVIADETLSIDRPFDAEVLRYGRGAEAMARLRAEIETWAAHALAPDAPAALPG